VERDGEMDEWQREDGRRSRHTKKLLYAPALLTGNPGAV
jgi:hypothetical protein